MMTRRKRNKRAPRVHKKWKNHSGFSFIRCITEMCKGIKNKNEAFITRQHLVTSPRVALTIARIFELIAEEKGHPIRLRGVEFGPLPFCEITLVIDAETEISEIDIEKARVRVQRENESMFNRIKIDSYVSE